MRRRARWMVAASAGACLTMVTSTAALADVATEPMSDLTVSGVVRLLTTDGDITAAMVPDQLMVDVEGTLLSPAAYDLAGLARGQAVAVTLAAPPGTTAAAAVADAGTPGTDVTVTSVTALGLAPTMAPPAAPSGSIALTVLPLRWPTPATPPQILRWAFDEAAAAWNGFSNGRLTVTPDVRGWATASGGRTCDPAALYNRALAAHHEAAPSDASQRVVVYTNEAACPSGVHAILGGTVLWVNSKERFSLRTAHALGHAFGLGHTTFPACGEPHADLRDPCDMQERLDVMTPPIDTVYPSYLNGALSNFWGWSTGSDAPYGVPTDYALTERGYGHLNVARIATDAGRVVVEPLHTFVYVRRLDLVDGIPTTRALAIVDPAHVYPVPASTWTLSVPGVGSADGDGVTVRLVPTASDTQPPTPVTLTGPDPTRWINASEVPRVTWTVGSDSGSGLIGHTMLFDGKIWGAYPAGQDAAHIPSFHDMLGTHTVVIRSTDATGNTADSAPLTMKIGRAPDRGMRPRAVTTDGTVALVWDEPPRAFPAATSYDLVLPGGRLLTVDGASPRSVELTGLTNGRTYSVLITAHNPVGEFTETGTIRPASEDQWIHVTGPDYWEVPFGPVQLGWSVSPEVESGTAYQAIELDGHVLRYVSAADRSADLRLRPGAHRLTVVAYDDEGEELFYGDTLVVGLYGQEEPRFGDVPVASPFHREIAWLAEAGITTGRADGTFGPAESISREAMAAFLYRLSGAEVAGYEPPSTPLFSDVPTDHPFYAAISWLAESGVTTGYADGTFGPGRPVSREAVAAFLYRFAGAGEDGYEPPEEQAFSDVQPGYGFFTEISWLAESGITDGYDDGRFGATDEISREAVAAFLCRFAGANTWDA